MPDPSGFPLAVEPPDAAAVTDLVAARARVLAAIAGACARCGRQPAEVTLVAVGKTVDGARLRAAVAAGFADLGENRVQEAAAKVPVVPGATWHLVGPLQANKARRAVAIFDVVETVDSLVLAERLDRLSAEIRPGRPLPVFLQVNVDADPAKAGFAPDELVAALPVLGGLANLELLGLMTVGRAVANAEAARPTFRTLRELSERVRDRAPRPPGLAGPAGTAPRGLGPGLSMGMSDDYSVAIEEGATLVRVGRAIFGQRQSPSPGGGAGRAAAFEEPSRGRSFTRPHPGRLVR